MGCWLEAQCFASRLWPVSLRATKATQGIERIPVRGPATSTTVLENKKAASAACRFREVGGFL